MPPARWWEFRQKETLLSPTNPTVVEDTELLAIQEALQRQRSRFVDHLSYPDLFGVAYCHVTRRERAALDAGLRRYPAQRIREIQAFFAPWQASGDAFREGRPVAAHWRRYYGLADALRHARRPFLALDRGEQLARLLRYGAEAHIVGDLPDALVAVFQASPVAPPELWPDFVAMDPLFARALQETLRDIDRATAREWGALRSTRHALWEAGAWLLGRFGDGEAWLRRLRHRAWEDAVRRMEQPGQRTTCRHGYAHGNQPDPSLR